MDLPNILFGYGVSSREAKMTINFATKTQSSAGVADDFLIKEWRIFEWTR